VTRAAVAGLLLAGGLSGCNITGSDVTQERANAMDTCLRKAGFAIRDVGVDNRGLDADGRDYNTVSATTPAGLELTVYAFESADVARKGYPRITFSRTVERDDPLVGPFVIDFDPVPTRADIAKARSCARSSG
jgi:hypothetical protein